MIRRRRTIFAVVRTSHHVCMMADALRSLEARGHRVQFAHFKNNPGATGAAKQLAEEGFAPILVHRVLSKARDGDSVLFAVKGGLDRSNGLDALAARGVRLMQACEGGRFSIRSKYHPRLAIPFLAWGPSARRIGLEDMRIVGAPFMDRIKRSPTPSQTALINYKFTYTEQALDPDGAWLRHAVAAARRAGFDPVVSAHPATSMPEGMVASDRPVADLVSEAAVLISRASTVIYNALLIGVQPFYLTVEGDKPMEYGKPKGAYPLCDGEDDLTAAMTDWASGKTQYDPEPFLDLHISRDANRPAAERMADAIEAVHLGPPLALLQGH